jgi:hypothetical protein
MFGKVVGNEVRKLKSTNQTMPKHLISNIYECSSRRCTLASHRVHCNSVHHTNFFKVIKSFSDKRVLKAATLLQKCYTILVIS